VYYWQGITSADIAPGILLFALFLDVLLTSLRTRRRKVMLRPKIYEERIVWVPRIRTLIRHFGRADLRITEPPQDMR
jgi:hypothetical protein